MIQKRWALLFPLTIFLPSAILSIFALLRLRNERFKLQQQVRDEQVSLIDSLKSGIQDKFDQLEKELQQVVRSPLFRNRDYPEMLILINADQILTEA